MHTSPAEHAAVRMTARQYVDFNVIPEAHGEIHGRLLNWASWCRPRHDSGYGDTSPMFRMYRSTARARREYGATTHVSVNKIEAQAMEKAVQALPQKHRAAIRWSYVDRKHPAAEAAGLGVSLQGLADLVRDARQMLVNRGA